MSYVIARTTPVDEQFMPKKPGTINGGMFKRSDELTTPVLTIAVEDIDKKMEEIKGKGGEILKEKMKVGDMGYASYFKDSEGNIIGLWEIIVNPPHPNGLPAGKSACERSGASKNPPGVTALLFFLAS